MTITKSIVSFTLPLSCSVESNSFSIDKVHTVNWKTKDIVGNVIKIDEYNFDEISDNNLFTISSEGTQEVIRSMNKRGKEIERIRKQEEKHQLHEHKVASLSFWSWITQGLTGFVCLLFGIIAIFFCIRHC